MAPKTPENNWHPELPDYLNRLVDHINVAAGIDRDPIRFPRLWPKGPDREVVAIISALLSYGRATSIGGAITSVVNRMGSSPSTAAMDDSIDDAQERFGDFYYRVTRGDDVARVFVGLGAILRSHGSISNALATWNDPAPDFRPLLSKLRKEIVRNTADFAGHRSFEHFLPNPARGSACKRYMMLLRWMVRGPDDIDLGDWAFLDPARLTMPLDTHVHRIGRYLGLTNRAATNWKTAAEITEPLRVFSPDDPIRYDFAIAHLGISGACPTYREPSVCSACDLNPVCQLPVTKPR
jgi:uncharacterized protein (TIGR02757 family)